MTAAVQHCTTAPRHVITLSTPRQPAQLLGAASPHMHAAAAATESAEWWPALSSHQPGVAWCRDGHTAGCRISPTAAVQLSPVLGCATRTAAASTAVLQHCSQPDTLSAAAGQSKRPAFVIEEFSKLRNMAIMTAAVLFIQSSDIDFICVVSFLNTKTDTQASIAFCGFLWLASLQKIDI